MASRLLHLSVGVSDPKTVASALARMSGGEVTPFAPLKGAYVCLWGGWSGQFVEFYPEGIQLVPTEAGTEFVDAQVATRSYSSSHLNLVVDLPVHEIIKIAEEYGYRHRYRGQDGGPLYEVWLENRLLVEFVTPDISAFA